MLRTVTRARHAARRYADSPYERFRARAHILRPWWARRFAEFGEGAVLGRPKWLRAPHLIAIGEGTVIFPDVWLAAEGAHPAGAAPVLRIGARCVIRHDAVLSATESVILEDEVGISGRVLVIDSDHTWNGPHAIVSYNPVVTAPVRIGRGTWVGEGACVLKGARIGRFCLVGANSVVRGDIPDFSIVAGVPARVVGSTRDRVPPHLL